MRFRSITLAVAFAMIVSGCNTAAQNQAQNIRSNLAASGATIGPCIAEVQSNPEYGELSAYMLRGDWTTEQLANPSKPTIKEAKLYARYSNEVRQCKKLLVSGVTNASPSFSNAMENALLRVDQVDIDLINRKTSWGEGAMKTRESANILRDDLQRASTGIAIGLAKAHAEELAARRRAAETAVLAAAAVGGAALAVAAASGDMKNRSNISSETDDLRRQNNRLQDEKARLQYECRKATNTDGMNAWKFSHCN